MADTREKFTKKTDEAVKLIEEASAMDCSIKEICLYANISKQTYYNWIEKDKKLKDRIDELRATPFLLARTTVITGIKENYSNAMDYLKRKKKLEFGDNINLDGNLNLTVKYDTAFDATRPTKEDSSE